MLLSSGCGGDVKEAAEPAADPFPSAAAASRSASAAREETPSPEVVAERLSLSKSLHIAYVAHSGEEGSIDQRIDIRNTYRGRVVPVLSFRAISRNHEWLPQVKVTTVFGSDRGNLVVPGGGSYDVLRFSGPGARDVADVDVTIESVLLAEEHEGENPAQNLLLDEEYVTVRAQDDEGRDVDASEPFTQVALTNEGERPGWVRVVHVVWDQPPRGATQQAAHVTPVTELTKVPAGATTVVRLTDRAKSAVAKHAGSPDVSVQVFDSQ